MLIRNAEVYGLGRADLRITGAHVTAIGALPALPDEPVIDARGGALLPGLHDHHTHLAALAVQQDSVVCGPPQITSADALAQALRAQPGSGWLRGTGYHDSVMGLPDAAALDGLIAHRPLRIQHRSGRMWLLNSLALDQLLSLAPPPPGLEREGGRFTGRLFDEDAWLRQVLAGTPPDFAPVSDMLTRCGVTGLTDMSPRNDGVIAAHFAQQRQQGRLRQHCMLAGTLELGFAPRDGWQIGPAKLHLHENAMPDFADSCAFMAAAHSQGRGVAVHCTTEVELVFTLAALEEAGVHPGDRIEHGSIAPDHLIARIAALRLPVVAQPHFIHERGDEYLTDVPARDHDALYRLRGFLDAGGTLAGGSDAPFGSADPWAAMAAAVSRRTRSGQSIGLAEALTPEEALALFLADPADLRRQRQIAVGARADLCLLDVPWTTARSRLSAADVCATIIGGRLIHDRVDQAESQSLPR